LQQQKWCDLFCFGEQPDIAVQTERATVSSMSKAVCQHEQ